MDVFKTTWTEFIEKLTHTVKIPRSQLKLYNVNDTEREFEVHDLSNEKEQNMFLSEFGLDPNAKYEFDVDNYPLASEPLDIVIDHDDLEIIINNRIINVTKPRCRVKLDCVGWPLKVCICIFYSL